MPHAEAAAGNAGGRPSISGTPTQGETLTAGRSNLGDPDGIDAGTLVYTWLRCDSNGNNCDANEIATGTTYTLTAAEVGLRLRLRADFNDNNGDAESRRGFPWPARDRNRIAALPSARNATLSALALADGDGTAVALAPAFAEATESYRAAVANAVDEITITPTTGVNGATVEYLDGTDMTISDADTNEPGQQVALEVGANTIKVKVTATDNTTAKTYTVVVTRAVLPSALVGNIERHRSGSGPLGAFDGAQSFTTGDNAGGYALTGVDLGLVSDSGVTTTPTVRLYSGSANGTKVADLRGPASLTADTTANYTFSASGNTVVLDASTRYWVVVEGVRGVGWGQTLIDHEDPGRAAGWSIRNFGQARLASSTGDFANWAGGRAFLLRISGRARSGSTRTDATLSALALADARGAAVTLSPVFSSATVSYTASVLNAEITISPRTNHGSATVAYLDDTDATINDADGTKAGQQVALEAGANTVQVKVTAADTTTTKTYTVEVTRTAAVATGRPSITGTPTRHRTLTAGRGDVGDINGIDAATLVYTWLRCDAMGESCTTTLGTGTTWTLTDDEVGHRVRVRLDFRDVDGTAESRESLAWPATVDGAIAADRPSISGSGTVGAVVAAGRGTVADPDGIDASTLVYTWLRCDATGESCTTTLGTGTTWTLTAAEVGYRVRVRLDFPGHRRDGRVARESRVAGVHRRYDRRRRGQRRRHRPPVDLRRRDDGRDRHRRPRHRQRRRRDRRRRLRLHVAALRRGRRQLRHHPRDRHDLRVDHRRRGTPAPGAARLPGYRRDGRGAHQRPVAGSDEGPDHGARAQRHGSTDDRGHGRGRRARRRDPGRCRRPRGDRRRYRALHVDPL